MNLRMVITTFCLGLATIAAAHSYAQQPDAKGRTSALSPTDSASRVITPLDASRIVSATGGQDFPANARDFGPIFKALAEEIRASYALAYYPENHDGKRHELRVKTSRPGIQIRASRTSYTAPTQ